MSQLENFLVRITRIRSQHYTGTSISALQIYPSGNAVPRASSCGITIPSKFISVTPQVGQWWEVTGTPEITTFETKDGFILSEPRFTAASAMMVSPSGSHIVSILSNKDFPGVGPVKARKLWERYKEELYDHLKKKNLEPIAEVVGENTAKLILNGWAIYDNVELYRWMQEVGISVQLGRKIVKVYGKSALEKIQEDPYRLISLGMKWVELDHIALNQMDVPLGDYRRLRGAVEVSLYDAFDNGDTYCLRQDVINRVTEYIGEKVANSAIEYAMAVGIVQSNNEKLFAGGPYTLERVVANSIIERMKSPEPIDEDEEIDKLICKFEEHESTKFETKDFALNEAQRLAVKGAARNSFFALVGGAGVGKTTVLNAIAFVLDAYQKPTYLMAPTGKAAKRMGQATNRKAITIAGFLRNVVKTGISEGSVIVIDESSMLDIRTAYDLVRVLPKNSRIILIGDSAQLPPIGPGLTLHVISTAKNVASVELTETRRFAGAIAMLASKVRSGIWTEMENTDASNVIFLKCKPEEITSIVLQQYRLNTRSTQVLSATKESGVGSTKAINTRCQQELNPNGERLTAYSNERERQENTGLKVGDPVICTTNLWDIDLQNGSTGWIDRIECVQKNDGDSSDEAEGTYTAWIKWDDGEERPVTDEILDSIELAYAITVHKSQGSEASIVIIPIYRARNFDRTLLYTAITRAKDKVILVGDTDYIKEIVERIPNASKRKIMLGEMLNETEEWKC